MSEATNFDTWSGELVRRFCAGDRSSVDELMAMFRPVVARAARRYVYSDHDVDDVIQETWMAFVAHAAAIREPERVVGWLRATATNVARRLATRNARVDVVENDALEGSDASFEEEFAALAEMESWRRAFELAVEQLSSSDRDLVRLLIDERGLTYATIGDLVDRPIGSIGPSRARVIDKLRRHPVVRALVVDDRADAYHAPALAH
jgi:RNA polymerase sigma factor (sigma-70 family)